MAMGDGRAVSAQIGAVNKLEIGPDDDLYVGEYERVLRIADPIGGLDGKPVAADARPPTSARRSATGARRPCGRTWSPPATSRRLDALRAAINTPRGRGRAQGGAQQAATSTQDNLDGNSTAQQAAARLRRGALRADGRPVSARRPPGDALLRRPTSANGTRSTSSGATGRKDPARARALRCSGAEIFPPTRAAHAELGRADRAVRQGRLRDPVSLVHAVRRLTAE